MTSKAPLLVVACIVLVQPLVGGQRPSVDEPIAQVETLRVDPGRQQENLLEGREGLDTLAIPELMDRFGVPGVSVAVIDDFEVVWAKGYGVADIETGARVDAGTLFQAASISKPVAAMATLVAVEDGHFALDDDINGILTTWQVPANGYTGTRLVTPRGLLSHTAGTGDGFGLPGYEPGTPTLTLVQILDGASPSNVGPVLVVRPRLTAFHYSGGGVMMMQTALTDVLGRRFADIVYDAVLRPRAVGPSGAFTRSSRRLVCGRRRLTSRDSPLRSSARSEGTMTGCYPPRPLD